MLDVEHVGDRSLDLLWMDMSAWTGGTEDAVTYEETP